MSLNMIKILKSQIIIHGSIVKEEGSERPEKLPEIQKKLMADSTFNTSNRIALK